MDTKHFLRIEIVRFLAIQFGSVVYAFDTFIENRITLTWPV